MYIYALTVIDTVSRVAKKTSIKKNSTAVFFLGVFTSWMHSSVGRAGSC